MMYSKQLGKMMEVYIDHMVIKSKEKRNQISDLKETFEVLRKYKLKLNASKCMFRVSSGKFHRHLDTNGERIVSKRSKSYSTWPLPHCCCTWQCRTVLLAQHSYE